MPGAAIAESSIVGACSFVPAKFKCPPRSLVIGTPARVKRELSDQEIEWKSRGTVEYQELAARCHSSLLKTTALTEEEVYRRRMDVDAYQFKPRE